MFDPRVFDDLAPTPGPRPILRLALAILFVTCVIAGTLALMELLA
jgi:hypothetical protein